MTYVAIDDLIDAHDILEPHELPKLTKIHQNEPERTRDLSEDHLLYMRASSARSALERGNPAEVGSPHLLTY